MTSPADRTVTPSPPRPRAVALGASAGGLDPLLTLLTPLPADFPVPLLLAQHLHKSDDGRLADHLNRRLALEVREARDKQPTRGGELYVAPADYHLLIERDGSLALSVDPRVNWSRPSIDVLFESAARAFGARLWAVILSGASDDGARGMVVVRRLGGLCIAQDPTSAASPLMPRAAIELASIETVLTPAAIGERLLALATATDDRHGPSHAEPRSEP